MKTMKSEMGEARRTVSAKMAQQSQLSSRFIPIKPCCCFWTLCVNFLDRGNNLKITRRSIQDVGPKDRERGTHTKTLNNALIDLSNWT